MKLLPQKQSVSVFCASGLQCIVLIELLVISLSLCPYFMVIIITQIVHEHIKWGRITILQSCLHIHCYSCLFSQMLR